MTKFGLEIAVLPQATFLVSNIVTNLYRHPHFRGRFAAISFKPDKLPLETELVAHDNNKI